jgi:hypothetical protein
MKKIATLFAVGVVALGASAQAAEVPSDEYAVITIPLVEGANAYNLVGVSVVPTVANATVADVFTGLNGSASIQTYNNGESLTPAEVSVSLGQAVWISNVGSANTTVYTLGVVPPEADDVTTDCDNNPAPVVSPFAAAWTPADTDLDSDSSTIRAQANKISIWQPALSKYFEYIYIPNNGWIAANRWTPTYNDANPPTIGAGQGAFVTFSTARAAKKSVKFSAPSAE